MTTRGLRSFHLMRSLSLLTPVDEPEFRELCPKQRICSRFGQNVTFSEWAPNESNAVVSRCSLGTGIITKSFARSENYHLQAVTMISTRMEGLASSA